MVLDQVSAYKTEMDSIAQFVEQECSLAAEAKYPASRLYEDYRHYCQILGRKPQSNAAFKKAPRQAGKRLPITFLQRDAMAWY